MKLLKKNDVFKNMNYIINLDKDAKYIGKYNLTENLVDYEKYKNVNEKLEKLLEKIIINKILLIKSIKDKDFKNSKVQYDKVKKLENKYKKMKSFKILDDDDNDNIDDKEIKQHINKNTFMSSDENIKIKYAFLENKIVSGTLTHFINITYDKWPSYNMKIHNDSSILLNDTQKSNLKVIYNKNNRAKTPQLIRFNDNVVDFESNIKKVIKTIGNTIEVSVGELKINKTADIILYYSDTPNITYKLNTSNHNNIISTEEIIESGENNPISKLQFDTNFTTELINNNKSKQLYLEIRGVNGYLNVTGNQSSPKTYKLNNIKIPIYNKENKFEEFDPDIFNV